MFILLSFVLKNKINLLNKKKKKICNSPDVESLYYLFLWRIVFGLVVCSQTQSFILTNHKPKQGEDKLNDDQ